MAVTANPFAALDVPWRMTSIAPLRLATFAFLTWTAVGLFQGVPDLFNSGFNWYMLLGKLIDAWSWILMMPALLLMDRWLVSLEQSVLRLSIVLLLFSIPVSFVHTILAGLLIYPFEEIWWNPLRDAEFAKYFFLGSWMTYCAIVGIGQALKFYSRFMNSQLELERVEKRLLEANLNALRLQLEPHFLFNALNAISSEVVADPKLAREMIENLGTLLRCSLDCKDSAEITLAEELALLTNYLAIQKVRFGDRIDVKINVEPEVMSIMVPSMLLQPLVENAIRHGIEARMSGGMIVVSAQKAGGQLEIHVQDNGVGLPPDWRMEAVEGVGLRVTRERISALYPSPQGDRFAVSARQGGGTNVTIYVPLYEVGTGARERAA